MRSQKSHTIFGYIGMGVLLLSGLMVSGMILGGCRRQEMPKPYAFARLDYPKTQHKTLNLPDHPCRFEYPDFFVVSEKPSGQPSIRWVDLRWSDYGVTLFTTYQRTNGRYTAEEQVEMMAGLLQEKLPKHTALHITRVAPLDSTLTAYVFEVDGPTSIPMEFLITDEKQHLFQGIIQFDQVPNRDTLADIIKGLSTDMHTLIQSFTFTPQL